MFLSQGSLWGAVLSETFHCHGKYLINSKKSSSWTIAVGKNMLAIEIVALGEALPYYVLPSDLIANKGDSSTR